MRFLITMAFHLISNYHFCKNIIFYFYYMIKTYLKFRKNKQLLLRYFSFSKGNCITGLPLILFFSLLTSYLILFHLTLFHMHSFFFDHKRTHWISVHVTSFFVWWSFLYNIAFHLSIILRFSNFIIFCFIISFSMQNCCTGKTWF